MIYSSHRLRQIEYVVKNLTTFCSKSLGEIEEIDIKDWMKTKVEFGCKSRTINQYVFSLSTFFDYCVEEKMVKRNPTDSIKRLSEPRYIPEFLTEEEIDKLRQASRINHRDNVILEILYCTGIRVGELCMIRLNHIDWEEKNSYPNWKRA